MQNLLMASNNWIISFLLLPFFILSTVAVDRNNFKTCQQSSFCKRQRRWDSSGLATFRVLSDTIELHPTFVRFQVTQSRPEAPLAVELYALVNNTVRLKVNELNPIKPRYEIPVGDALVKEPKQQSFQVRHRDQNKLIVAMESDTVVMVTFVPFSVDLISGQRRIFSVNSLGLMKFERLCPRQGGVLNSIVSWVTSPFRSSSTKDDAKDEASTKEKDYETDMWEEMFKTHKDSKPDGPTSVGLDVTFAGFEHVYGIPEHADTMVLKSTRDTEPYRLYNLDVFEYELYNPMALYGSVPLMLAHNSDRTVGLLWLNAAETWIDISHESNHSRAGSRLVGVAEDDTGSPVVNTHWFSESGIIDVLFLLGPTASDTFSQYATLTGTTPLPPLFSLGYHQSRWNYIDEEDVAKVNSGFDEHNIPIDVIWLDIEHTNGKRYFTWDAYKFPHPEEMLTNVSSSGRKMVTAVDPHLKRDDDYRVYKEARDLGLFVTDRDGKEFEGWCWPGSSSWLDFTNPAVRTFWAQKFNLSEYKGSTLDLFTWNDMNEPSVFNGPEVTMHKDARHFNGWEHRDLHNIFGLYVHNASTAGQLLRSNGRHRSFVLSRSFFAGSQRYGAVWTGDNAAEWSHLRISVSMMLTLNLVGITFSGADVGGFFKNPDEELLTRWYQAGAFQPFFRAHAHLDTRRREPWLASKEHLEAMRDAIIVRYRLLLYWYTLFFRAERAGGPVMRPLWVEFPNDLRTFNAEGEYMVGDALLVHPVTEPEVSSIEVFLPGVDQVWYDFDSFQMYPGNQSVNVEVNLRKIPVFYRGGYTVTLRERIRRSSTIVPDDPISLVIALDKEGNSQGELFVDDFHSFEYKRGNYIHREYIFKDGSILSSRNLNPFGSYKTSAWIERIYVVGLQDRPNAVVLSEVGADPVHLDSTYQLDARLLVIRKPGVNIATDFDLILS